MDYPPRDEDLPGPTVSWDGTPLPGHPAPPASRGEDARPIRLVVLDPDLERNRWTVVVRIILAIPLLIWVGLWTLFALLIGVVTWIVVLLTGRLPESLQDFFQAYVRFVAHLNAYLSFAANRYPSFVGKPGYAVDVEIDPTPPLSRGKAAIRLILALPALIFSTALGGSVPFPTFGAGGGGAGGSLQLQGGGALVAVGLLGWFVCLARGRMSAGLRDLAVYAIGYGAQVTGYLFFLTDRYPSAHPDAVLPPLRVPRHPVRVVNTGELRRSRLLTLLRLPLCFPHLVWLTLWSAIVVAISPILWLITLVLGRLPRPLHRFVAAWVRAYAQFTAFATLVAGPFPGFVGATGYPVDVTTEPPAPQHRAKTLFRLLLAVPAFIVSSAYSSALLFLAVLLWFMGLFLGRVPDGMQAFGAAAVRYGAQLQAYAFLVTDRYPYASPGIEEDTSGAPVPAAPAPWDLEASARA